MDNFNNTILSDETINLKNSDNNVLSKTDPMIVVKKNITLDVFKNNIENGYPHTNYDIVFITEKFIYNLLSYYNNNNIEGAIKDIGAIIIHEFIHVWQRKAPEKFNDLYTLNKIFCRIIQSLSIN